jgi:hypothetical protein
VSFITNGEIFLIFCSTICFSTPTQTTSDVFKKAMLVDYGELVLKNLELCGTHSSFHTTQTTNHLTMKTAKRCYVTDDEDLALLRQALNECQFFKPRGNIRAAWDSVAAALVIDGVLH